MRLAQIDYARCEACSPCPARKACRTKAIVKMGLDEQAIVKPSDCMGCGDCVEECPYEAVSMKES
ncbi:MAG: 4Fe-4S binding protein [Actinobacteria bacterium]|nr:4Fe-4S binding protein [Actinomycetota bacterium]